MSAHSERKSVLEVSMCTPCDHHMQSMWEKLQPLLMCLLLSLHVQCTTIHLCFSQTAFSFILFPPPSSPLHSSLLPSSPPLSSPPPLLLPPLLVPSLLPSVLPLFPPSLPFSLARFLPSSLPPSLPLLPVSSPPRLSLWVKKELVWDRLWSSML